MTPAEADPLTLSRQLARAAGLATALHAEPLPGGRNNRVFRVELSDGRKAALKIYFRHPQDPRDRLSAEWEFLVRAKRLAPGRTPAPLARDVSAGAALYSFVEGRRFLPEEVDAAAVKAAADFIRKVATPGSTQQLRPASESCFSIRDHLDLVDKRVDRLSAIDPAAPGGRDAARFVAERFRPAWQRVRDEALKLCRTFGIDPYARIDEGQIIASPSDFGFHNALQTEGGCVFLDFEYAGRDDPAKLVCDFFNQPDFPVAAAHREIFLREALDELGLGALRGRAQILAPPLSIKLIAIILNDFLPVGDQRRSFAKLEDQDKRRLRQLALARARLDALAVA